MTARRRASSGNMAILGGTNFLVSDSRGDLIEAEHGYFVADTRYLSKYLMLVNGSRPRLLTSRTLDYYSAAFYSHALRGKGESNSVESLPRESA